MKKITGIILVCVMISTLISAGYIVSAAESVPFDNMIALYNMTGNTLKDQISGNDGKLWNGASFVEHDGRNALFLNNADVISPGTGLGYDNEGQWAEMAAPHIPDSDELTISLWIKMSELRNWARAIDLGDANAQNEKASGNTATVGPNRFINISPTNGSNFIGTFNCNDMPVVPNTRDRSFGDQPEADTWIHAVYVVNKGKPNVLYVNGTAYESTNGNAGEDAVPATYSPKDLLAAESGLRNGFIGRSAYENNGDQIFYGYISDVSIFNVALTAGQVAELGKTDFSMGNPADISVEEVVVDTPQAETEAAVVKVDTGAVVTKAPATSDMTFVMIGVLLIASVGFVILRKKINVK